MSEPTDRRHPLDNMTAVFFYLHGHPHFELRTPNEGEEPHLLVAGPARLVEALEITDELRQTVMVADPDDRNTTTYQVAWGQRIAILAAKRQSTSGVTIRGGVYARGGSIAITSVHAGHGEIRIGAMTGGQVNIGHSRRVSLGAGSHDPSRDLVITVVAPEQPSLVG